VRHGNAAKPGTDDKYLKPPGHRQLCPVSGNGIRARVSAAVARPGAAGNLRPGRRGCDASTEPARKSTALRLQQIQGNRCTQAPQVRWRKSTKDFERTHGHHKRDNRPLHDLVGTHVSAKVSW
jgi:hypothetical protein